MEDLNVKYLRILRLHFGFVGVNLPLRIRENDEKKKSEVINSGLKHRTGEMRLPWVERSETPSNNAPSKKPEGAQQPLYNAFSSFGTLTQGISLGPFEVIAVAINIYLPCYNERWM